METQIIDGKECYRGFRPIFGTCTPEFKRGIDEFIQRCKPCGTGGRALDAAPKPKAAAPKPSREGRRLHRALDGFIESAFETPQEEQMVRNYDADPYEALNRSAARRRLGQDMEGNTERSERHHQIRFALDRFLKELHECKDPLRAQQIRDNITRIVKDCRKSGDLEPIKELIGAYSSAEDSAAMTQSYGESALLSDAPDYSALQRHADEMRLRGGVAKGTPEQKTTPGYGEVTYQPGLSPREMQPAEERGFEIDHEQAFSGESDYSGLQRHADDARLRWGRTRGNDSAIAEPKFDPENNRTDYLKIVAEVQASELRNGGLKQ